LEQDVGAMGRPTRVDFPGAVHHVIVRGNNKRTVFREEGEYRACLARLASVLSKWGVRCPAYVLMPTHLRLLLEMRVGPLAAAMRDFVGSLHRLRPFEVAAALGVDPSRVWRLLSSRTRSST